MNQQPPQWRPPAQPWRPPPGGAMPHAHGGTGGPPPYGATGYGPPGYGPPPAKKRMPTIGAVVALVGGLLGALQAVLPWLALVGVSVNGFGVNSLAERATGESSDIGTSVVAVFVCGLAAIVAAIGVLATKDNPWWAVIVGSLAGAAALVLSLPRVIHVANAGAIGYVEIGFWCFAFAGVVMMAGAIGYATRWF